MGHFYEKIKELPPDAIFGLTSEFKKDPRENKFNFLIGYFRDKNLQTPVLQTVIEVEKQLAKSAGKKEYLPIEGDAEFIHHLGSLVFDQTDERIIGVQTVGGTGALHLIGKLALQWTDHIAISQPSWSNHWKIFSAVGLTTLPYTYYEKGILPFEKMVDDLHSLPLRSCVLIHTNCHNPTGVDLEKDQWEEIRDIIEKKELYPVLDMAYQGFSSTPQEDAFAARLFLQKKIPFALTYTCAKNFSMYGERGGALFVVGDSSRKVEAIKSHLQAEIRTTYSNPPMHSAAIVKGILSNDRLRHQWLEELKEMRERMQEVRQQFSELMIEKNPHGHWETVGNGKGLFCYSELSEKGIQFLREEHGFYLAADGRINLTGLNQDNLDTFTEALTKALRIG